MAYRSAEHETTSNTPNFMMLGRETSTPLNIQYAMSRNIKSLPHNQWAGQLLERMNDAQRVVRANIRGVMQRQKRNHDQKLSWQSFQPGEEVFVFFLNVKTGQSHKLASRWHGAFRVLVKLTDVTYRVRCGRRRKTQGIHVDRLKRRQAQVLHV